MVPAEELRTRLASFQKELQAQEVQGALIVEKVDLYYFSGTMQVSFLYVPAEGKPLLMVMRDLSRARQDSALKKVIPLVSARQIPEIIREVQGALPATLGMEFDVLPVRDYLKFQEYFPESHLVDVSPLIIKVRTRKSAWEIAQMKKASEVSAEVYAAIPALLRPGITEIELGGLLEAEAKKRGHEGLLRMRAFNHEAYSWHVLSGNSGAILSSVETPAGGGSGLSPAFPWGASWKRIEVGEPILVDFGVAVNGYQVDQTRMYCLGKMPPRFRQAYQACVEVEQAILHHARPGVLCSRLYHLSLQLAEKLGFGRAYLGHDGQKARFVGHGIGLEIAELPFLAQGHDYPLEADATIAVEPKMVFPGEGAAGIEDTVVIGYGGCTRLTAMPDDIVEV